MELHAGLGTPIFEEFTDSQNLLRLSSNMRVTEIQVLIDRSGTQNMQNIDFTATYIHK